MESDMFTFKPVVIDKIREMISGELDESTTNQVIMILQSHCHGFRFISIIDLRELLCDNLSPKHLSNAMQAIKSNQY